jgi:ATP-binding cassette subfamily B protein
MVALACGLILPAIIKRLIDDGIADGRRDLIWPLSLTALGVAALRALANFVRRNLAGAASVRIEADLRARLFAHLQGLPISFHDRWQSGQLLARATSDLNAIRLFLGFAVVFLGFLMTTAIAVAIALFALDPLLALLCLGLAVPFMLTAMRFTDRMEDVAARSREAVGDVTNAVEESVGGVRILKAFGREAWAVDRLDRSAAGLRAVNLEAVRYRAAFVPALNLQPNLMLAAVLGIGGLRVIDGALSIGGLVAFNQYLVLLLFPLRFVGWILSMAQQAIAAGDRVFEILDTQPEIADAPGARSLGPLAGEVRFDDVTFTYPGSITPALVEVSFTVEPGETVAVVGATGSGKSTLAALLPRFFDPSRGRILLDGHDVSSVTLSSLRHQIGVVFDEPVLFSATIHDNIAFGFPDASRDDVERAARAAGAHEFIAALPLAYETRVGEQGYSLSGGQRQRIALARALLGGPRILILDDPLSSVDVRTEAEIEANLRSVLRGRTTFLIAHRASTVAMASRVLFLEDGRLTASGTHQDLLANHAPYRQVLAEELEVEDLAEVADR